MAIDRGQRALAAQRSKDLFRRKADSVNPPTEADAAATDLLARAKAKRSGDKQAAVKRRREVVLPPRSQPEPTEGESSTPAPAKKSARSRKK